MGKEGYRRGTTRIFGALPRIKLYETQLLSSSARRLFPSWQRKRAEETLTLRTSRMSILFYLRPHGVLLMYIYIYVMHFAASRLPSPASAEVIIIRRKE